MSINCFSYLFAFKQSRPLYTVVVDLFFIFFHEDNDDVLSTVKLQNVLAPFFNSREV